MVTIMKKENRSTEELNIVVHYLKIHEADFVSMWPGVFCRNDFPMEPVVRSH